MTSLKLHRPLLLLTAAVVLGIGIYHAISFNDASGMVVPFYAALTWLPESWHPAPIVASIVAWLCLAFSAVAMLSFGTLAWQRRSTPITLLFVLGTLVFTSFSTYQADRAMSRLFESINEGFDELAKEQDRPVEAK